MSIRFSNGVLERLLCAVMLRKFLWTKPSPECTGTKPWLENETHEIMLKLIEHNDAEGEYGSYPGTNLQ